MKITQIVGMKFNKDYEVVKLIFNGGIVELHVGMNAWNMIISIKKILLVEDRGVSKKHITVADLLKYDFELLDSYYIFFSF